MIGLINFQFQKSFDTISIDKTSLSKFNEFKQSTLILLIKVISDF